MKSRRLGVSLGVNLLPTDSKVCVITSYSIHYTKLYEKQQLSYTTVTCAPAPPTTDQDWYSSGKKAPLFNNLGSYSFPITTDNELVQRYFNQGLILNYGFNHAEAARSFYYATQLDPNCVV